MQLIHMIGRGIPGKADQVKDALAHFAKLLGAHRSPTDDGRTPQAELAYTQARIFRRPARDETLG